MVKNVGGIFLIAAYACIWLYVVSIMLLLYFFCSKFMENCCRIKGKENKFNTPNQHEFLLVRKRLTTQLKYALEMQVIQPSNLS